jgi:tetratricopeptide (TPR) repeat protein
MADQPAKPIIPGNIPMGEKEPLKDAIPACSVCGRQDETLRLISLPFVFSLIVVTFRRAMVGLWCLRHRNLRLVLAGSITSIFGWIGIPFGLIYTPIALLNLARGGNVPIEPNLHILKRLAEHKLNQGDIKGAVRCFEEVLKLNEDEDTLGRLSELYRKYTLTLTEQEKRTILPLLFLLISAPLIGAGVGLVDYLSSRLFNLVSGQEVSIFVVILSWIPLVAGTYLAGIVLSNVLNWALTRYRMRNQPLGMSLAVVTAGLSVYGLPEGRATVEYLSSLLSGLTFDSLGEAVQATGAILTRGGVWFVGDAIRNWGTAGPIYILILFVAFTFFVVSGTSIARSLALQQQRVDKVRPASTVMIAPSELSGWLTLTAVLAGVGFIVAVFLNVPELQRGYPAAIQHAELGEQLYFEDDFEEAAFEFEKAIKIDPNNGVLHSNLGYTYLNLGRNSEAKREFQEAIRLGVMTTETYLGLGFTHLALEEFESALPHLERVLELNPTDEISAQAHFAKSAIYLAQGEIEQTILELEETTHLQPENSFYQISLAWAYFNNNDLDQALQSFQYVLRLEPESVEAAIGLAYVQLGYKNTDEAEAEFEAIIEMNIDDLSLAQAYFGLAEVYQIQNDLAKAAQILQQGVGLDPDSYQSQIQLIYTFAAMGEFEQALDQCEVLITKQPQWAAPVALKAWVYLKMGHPQVSGAILARASLLEGEDLDSIVALGFAYMDSRWYRKAEEMFLKAIALSPNNADIQLYLAGAYARQNKYDEVLETIEEILRGDDESVDAYLALGTLYLDQEEIYYALGKFLHALELGPDDWGVHSSLSFTYFHLGQVEKALAEARETIRLNSYSARGYKNLAFAYHAQGNLELAVEAAQEAIRISPIYDTAYYILGVSYMEMGEKEKAEEALEHFLVLYIDRGFVRDYKVKAQLFLEELR